MMDFGVALPAGHQVVTREACVMDESHLTIPSFRDSFKIFCDTFLVTVQPYFGTTNAGPGVPKR